MKTSMNDEPDFYLSRGEIGRLIYAPESYHNEKQHVIASERKAEKYRPGVAATAGADAQELRDASCATRCSRAGSRDSSRRL